MQITSAQRDFARLVRETRFGSIEHIRLNGGQPVIDANLEVRVVFRLSGVEPPLEVMTDNDYLGRPQVRAMFERFEQVREGIVECLDVRDGLPFKMTVRRGSQM